MKRLHGGLALLGLVIGASLCAAPAQQPGAAPTPAYKARPAEIEPLAAQHLMLDVVDSGQHLIAVGDRGHILASNDGRHWAQVAVPVRAPLTALSFVDADHGWAVGHDATILRTLDGGRNWTLQMFEPALEKPFLDVLFLDVRTGFAVGAYGLFYRTEDGGSTWAEVDAPEIRGDELHLYSIARLGNGNLFVAGEQGLLALSTDRGVHWKKLASPYESTLFGIVPHGANGALICGLRGNAFLTEDVAGGKWRPLATGTKASLFGGARLDDDHAALVGLSGTVLVADLGLATTTALKSPVDSAYSGVVKWGQSLVLAGEQGLQQIPLTP